VRRQFREASNLEKIRAQAFEIYPGRVAIRGEDVVLILARRIIDGRGKESLTPTDASETESALFGAAPDSNRIVHAGRRQRHDRLQIFFKKCANNFRLGVSDERK
jgi:hypothetical protein